MIARPFILAASLLLSIAVSANAQSAEQTVFRVPVAPPHIVIVAEGEKAGPWVEPPITPENEIYLRSQAGAEFDGKPPANVREGVEVLRAALPEDYKQMLMEDWGYLQVHGVKLETRREDLRLHDLAHFLFRRWVQAAPDTQIAREFACLSWGEEDIGLFLTLLTNAEALDYDQEGEEVWQLKPDVEESQQARYAVGSTRLLLVRCQQLIDMGVDADDR